MLDKLLKYGWLLKGAVTPEQLALARQLYAAFHGLSSVKDVEDHLQEPRFCNHPDVQPIGTTMCKWPSKTITWSLVQSVHPRQVEAATEAFSRWARVCGIIPQHTQNNQNAMIVIGSRSIDGAMGVLAESELPCGNVAQCHQWYDTSEPWDIFDSAIGGKIDLVRVMCHEIGHALGMNHIGAGNLLAPTYSPTINSPQAGDIAEMQARYGPPMQAPPPVGGDDYVIRVNKGQVSIDGYRLTKLLEAE